MEISVILPCAWLLLLLGQASLPSGTWEAFVPLQRMINLSPFLLCSLCLILWLTYLLALDVINGQQIESPRRELSLLLLITLSTLLLVRILLYSQYQAGNMMWIAETFSAVFNFTSGWRPELALWIFNLVLWIRVVMSLSRSLTFMSVGLSFRLSMLLSIVANSILFGYVGSMAPTQYFGIFLGFGLTAVALARVDEKALAGHHSQGSALPWPRVVTILACMVVVLVVGVVFSRYYTPNNIVTILSWFSPLWQLIGWLLAAALAAVLWVLAPLIDKLVALLRRLMANSELLTLEITRDAGRIENEPLTDPMSISKLLQDWPMARYFLVLFAILCILAFLWFFFIRPYTRQLSDEVEEAERETGAFRLNSLRHGLNRLQNLMNLLRRFGLSMELLDAISVENMYANLGRLANEKGYPRQPNHPPDLYIHELNKAFPGQLDNIRRLTMAYMRVHYGDEAIDRSELTQLRSQYDEVVTSADETGPTYAA